VVTLSLPSAPARAGGRRVGSAPSVPTRPRAPATGGRLARGVSSRPLGGDDASDPTAGSHHPGSLVMGRPVAPRPRHRVGAAALVLPPRPGLAALDRTEVVEPRP